MKLFILFFTLGLLLSGCSATIQNNENSDELLEKSTEQVIKPGSDAYYLNIAKDLYVAQQYKQVYQITAGLAEKNNVEAQYLLGYLYYYGQGVPVDVKQGAKWISISADSGYRPAIEALVLIKHGLTPDNKCSSVDLSSANTEVKVENNPVIDKPDKEVSAKSNVLKKGEILITPKKTESLQEAKNIELIRSENIWKRFTIQLILTESSQHTLDYASNFKIKHPDLKDYIITYQSKGSPHYYGVGFSTFLTLSEAEVVLDNIRSRLNDSTLFVKSLDKYTPLSSN